MEDPKNIEITPIEESKDWLLQPSLALQKKSCLCPQINILQTQGYWSPCRRSPCALKWKCSTFMHLSTHTYQPAPPQCTLSRTLWMLLFDLRIFCPGKTGPEHGARLNVYQRRSLTHSTPLYLSKLQNFKSWDIHVTETVEHQESFPSDKACCNADEFLVMTGQLV